MVEITCRCKKSKKNFRINIGEFYIDDCCLEAGYDELGNLIKKELDLPGLPTEDDLKKMAKDLKDDTSQEPNDEPPVDDSKEALKAKKAAAKAAKAAEKAAKEAKTE